jgi:ankyrin repeat protein
MVERLLAAGADAKATLTSGETALMACARTGSVDAVEALLNRGAEVNVREAAESQTALMWATAQRHPAVVRLLLDHGADPNARSRVRREVISRRLQADLRYGERSRSLGSDAEETDIGGFTPLLFTARVGDIESARLLLAAGGNVDDTGPDGASALVVATHSGHGALARFLLDEGANPNAAIVGYTALHAAVLQGDVKVVEALLDHGASPNAQITQGTRVARNGQVLYLGEHLLGATPFALAAKFIEVEIMRVLLDAGADAALPLKNGWTPVSLAAGAGWRYGTWDRRDRALIRLPAAQRELYDERRTLEAVKMAAEAGSDVNAADEDGNTALHHVVDKGFPSVVAFLTESGARVNVENQRGQTPLTRFARRRPEVSAEATRATGDLLHGLGAR